MPMDPAYKERRQQALQKMMAALAADDDDTYCEGYDDLVKTERDAGEFDDHPAGVCRICGCIDEEACPEGCYWVEPNLCSSCVDKAYPEGDNQP
jgi:hypothetical protein